MGSKTRLVKIVYRHTPDDALAETFFKDDPDFDDKHYEGAFRQYHPVGVIVTMERSVKPTEEHKCA